MSFKTRMKHAWEKIKFFFYRLTHPGSRKKIVEGTKDLFTDVKEGAVLYIKTGQVKMRKVTLSSRLKDCYAELGIRYVEMIQQGRAEPDEEIRSLLQEISSIKEELKKIEAEEKKASPLKKA